jgi:hypothetical protein
VEQDGDILVAFSDPEFYDNTGEWQGNPINKVRFERFDFIGNVLLEDSLNESPGPFSVRRSISQLSMLNDGNILVGGYHELRHGFLAKIDATYETIWFERYTPYEYIDGEFPDFNTQILNTIETSDGGFLSTGMFLADPGSTPHPYGFQSAIALKVDEWGCVEENCQVGVVEREVRALQIFPNPATDFVYIELPDYLHFAQVRIINSRGKEVQAIEIKGHLSGERIQIDASSFSPGLYTVCFSIESDQTFIGRFIKE